MTYALQTVGVCGAGAMGSGIAQLAAQHGATVKLYDLSSDALAAAKARIAKSFDDLSSKGRLNPDAVAAARDRIATVTDIAKLSDCDLVIEAIVEDAGIKGDLFAELEAVMRPTAVIATNTSSLPIARLARTLRNPARFVGMHFFNPPTAMKLVEVIAGPASDPSACEAVHVTAEAWGKVAVRAADVPGFIVNRVARPFYAEAFIALQEHAGEAADIDALFKSAGFRMGPLELTDFIGQDVNFTVARSIYDSYFGRTRFVPQLRQAALVDAGCFGRKSGRGVYDYSATEPADSAMDVPVVNPFTEEERAAAETLGHARPGEVVRYGDFDIAITAGISASKLAAISGRATVLFDWFDSAVPGPIGFASSDQAGAKVATHLAVALSRTALRLADRPGLIVCRSLAQIANAGADAVFDHVSDEKGIDAALRFGANYPFGPFGWADRYGRGNVRKALASIAEETGDAIYSPSQYMKDW